MTIQISRNAAGNCVTFAGATQPAYWNACLSAQINTDDNTRVDIINDIRSAAQGEVFFEFYAVDPAGFSNGDGEVFASAQAMVDYVNLVGNVTGTGTEGIDLNSETAVNFRLDQTQTAIFMSTGHQFGVNTIKAVADSDGTIHIQALGEGVPSDADSTVVEKEHFQKLIHTAVQINGAAVSGGLNDVVNALNELFTVGAFQSVVIADPYSTMVADVTGTSTTGNIVGTYGIDPIGDDVFGASASGSLNGYKTVDTIDQAGEYFTFQIRNRGQIGFGLIASDDTYTNTLYANGSNTTYINPAQFGVGNNAHYGFQFSHWFHPTPNGSWTNYGANTGYVMGQAWHGANTHFEARDEWVAGTPITIRVGINENGFIHIDSLADDGTTWKQHARTSYAVREGSAYHLGIKMGDTTVRLYSTPKVHLLTPAAPTMNFRYIESPDGVFQYPLFATAEEANYYDLNHDGTTGTGTSHTHVFVDDATASTWYMSDTGGTHTGTSAPSGATFMSNPVTYTEITSLSNADLVPAAYTDNTVQVNELAAVNINVHPSGASWTTTVNVGTSGLTYDSVTGSVTGTAPEVTGDNVANPSDDYDLVVTRTNSYGSSTGTLTVQVNNLTAPVTAISGFTHDNTSAAMVDSDTMGDGAAVHVHNTLDTDKRFVITQDYIETNILPNLVATGDKYYIGIPVGSHSFATVTDSDWDAAIVWEYETATSHSFKFIDNGTIVQNIIINSATDAFYDYAIEAQSTNEAWLIACNINSINTELSPADGGSFSHTREVTGMDSSEPHTIHMAVVSTTGDISTTGISEIDVPTAPAGLTSYSKALDFSGSAERMEQVTQDSNRIPMKMYGQASLITGTPTAGYTSNNSSAKPWATSIIFRIDGNSSNQHIWNLGEGSGTNDDNIYLRLDASQNLYFGWGRIGELNECRIATSISTSYWYGVYVGHDGRRWGAVDATSTNLAATFDIRLMSSQDSFASSTDVSTSANWITTGGRMDRNFTGAMTIGGRGGNRNFHGKVASFATTTLRRGVAMPTTAELEMMTSDPMQWLQDYKVGNAFRLPWGSGDAGFNFNTNDGSSSYATQVWLMGDGTSDSYTNGIRNQVQPADATYTKLNFVNMVSSDIENVTIPGLS